MTGSVATTTTPLSNNQKQPAGHKTLAKPVFWSEATDRRSWGENMVLLLPPSVNCQVDANTFEESM